MVPPTFLRFDRPELEAGRLVVRAVPEPVRAHRRVSPAIPLGYRYEVRIEHEPVRDFAVTAGHFDQENLVWSFSGELDGILGLTESYPSNGPGTDRPGRTDRKEEP
jgi:hypothetical protein